MSYEERLQNVVEQLYPYSPCRCDDDVIANLRNHRKKKLIRKIDGLTEAEVNELLTQWENEPGSAKGIF